MVKKHLYIVFSLFLVLIDQIVKYFIVMFNPNLIILPFFSIVFVKNQGAAFGILQGMQWFFVLIAILVLVFLVYYYKKIESKNLLMLISWTLFVAGLIGNLIDRLFRGYVVDFISIGNFPAFNVADSLLCIAVTLLIAVVWNSK